MKKSNGKRTVEKRALTARERAQQPREGWTDAQRQPSIIGSVWRRKEPAAGDYTLVRVTAVVTLAYGQVDLVVTPIEEFGSPDQLSFEYLTSVYERDGKYDSDQTQQRMNALMERLERMEKECE